MADDPNDIQQVTVGSLTPTDPPLPNNEETRKFAAHYGQQDLDGLRNILGSNSIVARQFFDDVMAEKFGHGEKSAAAAAEPQSPQEKNVTGKLDHTGDVPTRIKVGAAAEVAPVVNAAPAQQDAPVDLPKTNATIN